MANKTVVRPTLIANEPTIPVIPGKTNRTKEIIYDQEQYTLRQKVERFFNTLTQFRRIATRYDTLSRTFLAFIHIAATWIMIR